MTTERRNETTAAAGGANETVVCHCYGRTAEEIRQAAAKSGLTDSQQIADAILAGAGCTLCRPLVDDILQDIAAAATREELELESPTRSPWSS